MKHTAQTALGAIAALCAVGISVPATAAWEPMRPVEFIVPVRAAHPPPGYNSARGPVWVLSLRAHLEF